MRLTDAELAANDIVQYLPWKSSTIYRSDLAMARRKYSLVSVHKTETFCEKNQRQQIARGFTENSRSMAKGAVLVYMCR